MQRLELLSSLSFYPNIPVHNPNKDSMNSNNSVLKNTKLTEVVTSIFLLRGIQQILTITKKYGNC